MSISDYQRQDDSEPLPTDGVSYPAVPGGWAPVRHQRAPKSSERFSELVARQANQGNPRTGGGGVEHRHQ